MGDAPGWDEIERAPGLGDARRLYRDEIEPALSALPQDAEDKRGMPKNLGWPITLAFGLFLISFWIAGAALPDTFIGNTFEFLLFPVLFLGAFALVFWLYRDRFFAMFLRGQTRFLARTKVLSAVAERFGFDYVAAPGGAPAALKAFLEWKRAPKELREISELLDRHGGLNDALAAAKAAGVMAGATIVIGGDEARRKHFENEATAATLEDGFRGAREGVEFSAFEWVESVEDADDVHHLVIVLTAPLRLHGLTQLRMKGAGWPRNMKGVELDDVDLGPKVFSDRFRLRTQDQTEARAIFNPAVIERVATLAHGEKIKAAAFDNHLVIDIAGGDRFDLISLTTGRWSEEGVRRAIADVIELAALVDEAAHAFMVRPSA